VFSVVDTGRKELKKYPPLQITHLVYKTPVVKKIKSAQFYNILSIIPVHLISNYFLPRIDT